MKTPAKPRLGLRRQRARGQATAIRGDVARAMFARWERDHVDPKPVSWEKLQATLEATRLREARLFTT